VWILGDLEAALLESVRKGIPSVTPVRSLATTLKVTGNRYCAPEHRKTSSSNSFAGSATKKTSLSAAVERSPCRRANPVPVRNLMFHCNQWMLKLQLERRSKASYPVTAAAANFYYRVW